MKTGIVAVVVIAILGLGGWALTRNNDSTNKTNSSQSSNTNNTSQKTPISTNSVNIKDFAFSPADITIKKGTTVTWTNNDSTAHQPVADSGNGPKSPALQPGETYSFTYNQTGTFKYHCSIHPEMTGTVSVTD